MAVLITGASGLVGQRLAPYLQDVIATSRNAVRAKQSLGSLVTDVIQWDPLATPLDLSTTRPIRAVVNLMGDSVAEGRWNAEKKKSIRDSRVIGTQKLVAAVLAQPDKPEVFISASAVGYYGSRGDETLTEASGKGSGFLADVSQQWENATLPLVEQGIRVVKIRIGIVMADEGGALEKILPPFKAGVGGPLGDGKQYFPWIHIEDLVGIIVYSVFHSDVLGIVNAVAPGIVTNGQFTKALATAVGRPAVIPAPKFALRLLLGEFAETLFHSQRVIPQAILASGYQFQYPDLESCLADLIK